MRSGRWVLLGTFAFALGNNGVYFLIGRMLPADVVGTYFFAFQVITSLAMLLSNNSYQVLFAAFSRVRDDTARLRGAVLQALKVVVLIASAVSLAIAAVFRPLEHVLWHGKWASAVGAVEVFAVTWPLIAFISVLHAVQAARGRFRVWGLVALVTSIAAVAGSVLGALLGRTATAAAIGYGIGTVVGMLVNIQYSLVPLGLWPFTTTLTSLRPWVAAIVAAAVAAAVGRSLSGHDPAAVALSAACFVVAGYWSLRLLARDSMRLTMSSVAPIVVRALGRLRPASGNG